MRDAAAVRRAIAGVDGVFNLAAEVGVGQSMYEIERYVAANDLGTAISCRSSWSSRCGAWSLPSMSIYGEGLYRTPQGRLVSSAVRRHEDLQAGRWEPRDAGEVLEPVPTDETKQRIWPRSTRCPACAGTPDLMLCAAYGMEGVALRLFNVSVRGQQLSNPYTGVLAIFSGRLLIGQPPSIFEDGAQRRDFVHASTWRAFASPWRPRGGGGKLQYWQRPQSQRS